MNYPQSSNRILHGWTDSKTTSLPIDPLAEAVLMPTGRNLRSEGGLEDYLKVKHQQVVQCLREVIPGLEDIEIDKDVTHSTNNPFPILNACLYLRLHRSIIPNEVRHEGAKIEILVADNLLSAFFTISDPSLRDKGLSTLFFGKILEISPQITKGSFSLTSMNGIAFMLALSNFDVGDLDRFKNEVNRIYADKTLLRELHLRFNACIESMSSTDSEKNKESIESAFFKMTPLGRMVKQFGFSKIYEVDIDITGRTPDCTVRVSRDLQASLNTKLTIIRPGGAEAEVLVS